MARNYNYVATVNGVPVLARRRKYALIHDMKHIVRHASDNVRYLRMGDYQHVFMDFTDEEMKK